MLIVRPMLNHFLCVLDPNNLGRVTTENLFTWEQLSRLFATPVSLSRTEVSLVVGAKFRNGHRSKDALLERTIVPLEFAPCGSMFIVFRTATKEYAKETKNFPSCKPVAEISGPWTVKFDSRWGGPASVTFDKLEDWTKRSEDGIRFYSGTATYTKQFDLDLSKIQNPKSKIFLDLGDLRELAEVRLNGRSLDVVWSPPFRVEVTGALKSAGNVLEVEIVNFWPNRLIGDASLPLEKRFTKTNIRKLTKDTPLTPSGLFGPVTLLTAE